MISIFQSFEKVHKQKKNPLKQIILNILRCFKIYNSDKKK